MIEFGTKAETLKRIASTIQSATILPQFILTLQEIQQDVDIPLSKLEKMRWFKQPLIVRSSTQKEDRSSHSMAGHFTTVLNVRGKAALNEAIGRVIGSYDRPNPNDQVLIQPMLQDVSLSGVALSRDPSTHSPYFVINYDDKTDRTNSVTQSTECLLNNYYHYRYSDESPPPPLDKIIGLVAELEALFDSDALDIEFAISSTGELYLFQVRPLVLSPMTQSNSTELTSALNGAAETFRRLATPSSSIYGEQPCFGTMPDWNPAEMIGVRPKPLALSLYKELITNEVWAEQRALYGYQNLRKTPLMVDYHGLPYVDVRASFNSFIPANLNASLSKRLVQYYLHKLETYPYLHDKIEFEIVFSCYTFDLHTRLKVLSQFGFNLSDREAIAWSLKKLTEPIIDPVNGYWRSELKKLSILEERHATIFISDLDLITKVQKLVQDCKQYGTLPFAGLARSAFIALQLLQSLVTIGVINKGEYYAFLNSTHTVSSAMREDIETLSRSAFLERYGHLRPGSYDLLSLRYDQAPDLYFDWSRRREKKEHLKLTSRQMDKIEELLEEHGMGSISASTFIDFLKSVLEGREYAKFVFSKNLSLVLELIKEVGHREKLSPEDCTFLDFALIKELDITSHDLSSALRESIRRGKNTFKLTQQLILPPLIHSHGDFFSFSLPESEPNYITLNRASGHKAFSNAPRERFNKAIVFLPHADPGYDWIFTHNIAGLITMYGGVNSHMAIRASEFGLPAVIGAGERLYNLWQKGNLIEIDCSNRQVRILQ